MIDIQNLFHHYGSKPVLCGLSFGVGAGEIVVVMGPNGMGKSTLLACIGGAIVPRAGRVVIGGAVRYSGESAEMDARRKVMYLPDAPWMPESRTCRQWAVAVALLYREDDAHVLEHVDSLIKLFEMENVADSPIMNYSAGQKKKAMLIMALAPETPILVLDEPFSGGLDPMGLVAIKEVLKRRAKIANNAILISTPTPELVEEVADRVIILQDGNVAAAGTLAELKERAGMDGGLAEIYQRLSSSKIESNVQDYEKRFLS